MKKNTIRVNKTVYNVKGITAGHNGKLESIFSAYGRPSSRKISIWHRIESICAAFNGYNLTVLSATCFFFSCSFEFKHAGKKYRMYFYPSRWYQVYKIA